jgi:methanethiol S-methyltransferase
MSTGAHIILGVLWIAFGVLHSVLAAGWWKRLVQQVMGGAYKYYPFLYSVFAAGSLTGILIYQFRMESRLLFALPVWAKVMAGVLALAGAGIMVNICRKYFFALSGISVFYKEQPPVKLELGGLHRYVRHPLYFGTLLFIWALFFLMPYASHLIACSIITIYTVLGTRIEEKKLVQQFGAAYTHYQQRVPMLMPGRKTLKAEC